jgi:hypothetical protein
MLSSSRTQATDRARLMLGGATSGLGSPGVRSSHGPSCIRSCLSQFRVVVQGISPLIWRRLLGRSDMPLVTIHMMASATALGNASARALWNRRSIRRSASGSAPASRCSEPQAGRISYDKSARACEIAIGRLHSGSGIQGSVPHPANRDVPQESHALLCRQNRGIPFLGGRMSAGQALGTHQEPGWYGVRWQG